MKRGEVRWVTFNAPDKRRPVLILTRSSVIRYLTLVTVAPITTTIRGIGSEVLLTQEDGLLTDCVVNLDNIQTISQAELGDMITILSGIRMAEVDEAIKFALGIDEKFY